MKQYNNKFKSQKALIYRKMGLNGINPHLKENQVIKVQTFKNPETDERGWNFETKGGHFGRVILFKGFEYKKTFYPRKED